MSLPDVPCVASIRSFVKQIPRVRRERLFGTADTVFLFPSRSMCHDYHLEKKNFRDVTLESVTETLVVISFSLIREEGGREREGGGGRRRGNVMVYWDTFTMRYKDVEEGER